MNVGSWAAPLINPDNLLRVSPHVHAIADGGVPGVPNAGIVVGGRAALVIDTGIGEPNGRAVLGVARKLAGDLPLRLVTTHVHPEHDLGASAFPAGTVMIRSRPQVEEIAETGLGVADDFRKRSTEYAELLAGARFREPDIVFDDVLVLDLGGVRVQLRAMGPNHTPGDTIALVVDDGVVFSGDIAMRPPPSFASPHSSLRHWLTSLDELQAMRPRIIVPSHGPFGGAELIEGYRRYLRDVRRLSRAAWQEGRSAEQAVAEIVPQLIDAQPDAVRIAGAVRVAYREAESADEETGEHA
ncbi:MBL fold metallo-hydrolase [Microbacterium sp. MAHUQ-60]|uniref:MBL fold metallo-hydrolase n=1 Tax=unclassified Microbacterium TaxID=2609290 RepID=UPI00361EB3A3